MILRKIFIFSLLFLFSFQIQAQGESAWWHFGGEVNQFPGATGPVVDFNSGAPVNAGTSPCTYYEGTATVSDKCGNLLFYTNGRKVWNNANNVMPNGNNLEGDSDLSRSQSLIVPDVFIPGKYYIFHHGTGSDRGLHYSVVDMSLNGGLGDVVPGQKNVYLLDTRHEKVAATLFSDRSGHWVVTYDRDVYYAFPVDVNGVGAPVVTNLANFNIYGSYGLLKISPDGTRIANSSNGNNKCVVADFNDATGVISNEVRLQSPVNSAKNFYGIEFSPNSQLLYANLSSAGSGNSCGNSNHRAFAQYDLTAPNVNNAVTTIYDNPNDFNRGHLQIARDGKIYANRTCEQFLAVINNPDVVGTGCNYVHDGFALGGTSASKEGLPQFVASFFRNDFYATDASLGLNAPNQTTFCITDTIKFTATAYDLCPSTTVIWDFGDGNTSTVLSPTHQYTATGTYTVTLDLTFGGQTFTSTNDIIITGATANPVNNVSICDTDGNGSEIRDLTVIEDPQVLGTQTAANYTITYHSSQADADSGTNPLTMPATFNVGTTTVFARIVNNALTTCPNTTSFDIIVGSGGTITAPNDLVNCDDNNDGFSTFDLTTIENDIHGGNPAGYTFTYYNTAADAAAQTNPILVTNPFPNTTINRQTIFVTVENTASPNCDGETQFDIVVVDTPTANTIAAQELCDDVSNDGTEDIDLTTLDSDVLGTQSATDFSVLYFANQADADSNTNPVASPYTLTTDVTLYVRIHSIQSEDCYDTTSFMLSLSSQAVANPVGDIRLCDDVSNDGTEDFDLNPAATALLGIQNSADFTINFFTSQADADLGTTGGAVPVTSPYSSTGQTLYARIESNSNTACYDTTSFDLIVDALPLAGTPADIVVCDDTSNDGVEDVDLSQFNTAILDGQTNANFIVSYHSSQADADADANALSSPYTVSSATPSLFARIDNGLNGDCYDTTTFQFVISPTPTANPVQNMVTCDDDSNDGTELFDLTMADAEVLGTQNPADFTITYHLTQNDAMNDTGDLTSPFSNTTSTQTITARIESNTNSQCFDMVSFDLIVSVQPTVGALTDLDTCDDMSNDGTELFDLSVQNNVALNGLNAADFTVSYHATFNDAANNTSSLNANYNNTSSPQTIYVRLTNNDNSDCFDISMFNIEVFAKPDVAAPSTVTICAGIDEVLDAGAGFTSYDWSTSETTQTITVDTAGTYTVTVRNAQGCENTVMFTVLEGDLPVINDIIVNEFEINTNSILVMINNPENFQYSLDNIDYQDSRSFDNLLPGVYTVYVRDRNGCATVERRVVILGAPPYFTPNEDGFHDFWQVYAGDEIPDANIYIFDRYGKLLKQISPTGIGWDGTYNDQPMPSSDYWYLVELADGRNFKGHFTLKR
ncbi:MAG: T9SS type B sorting domain-containing protein [Nonlabens sp.]|uniref:T9SS type B sorting domain-containing protein n=1 Tax=Nonlabens sp. TaxID=1888209 RepID=UPI003EF78528